MVPTSKSSSALDDGEMSVTVFEGNIDLKAYTDSHRAASMGCPSTVSSATWFSKHTVWGGLLVQNRPVYDSEESHGSLQNRAKSRRHGEAIGIGIVHIRMARETRFG
jgi:hypothetical protein